MQMKAHVADICLPLVDLRTRRPIKDSASPDKQSPSDSLDARDSWERNSHHCEHLTGVYWKEGGI